MDRQLQLAMKDYSGRSLSILTMDETRNFVVVKVLAEVTAYIQQLIISCVQPDGTSKRFYILMGEQPTALPGVGYLRFDTGGIIVKNVGNSEGTLYIKITDDVGTTILYYEASVPAGDYFSAPFVRFDMPERDYGLIIEVGHL